MYCAFSVVKPTSQNELSAEMMHSLFPLCVASKRKSQSGKTLWSQEADATTRASVCQAVNEQLRKSHTVT